MSTLASLPLETMTLGLENILASSILSKALIARRKSSTESVPEKALPADEEREEVLESPLERDMSLDREMSEFDELDEPSDLLALEL